MTIVVKSQNARAKEAARKAGPRFFNRELSWLQFNARVIDEAENVKHPLLERLRFLAISGSNLDEFYMVRIGEIREHAESGDHFLTPDGLTAAEQLERLSDAVDGMVERQQRIWVRLRGELDAAGVCVVEPEALNKRELAWLEDYFQKTMPNPQPVAVREDGDLPFIPNRGIVLGVEFETLGGPSPQKMQALILMPADAPRFVKLPEMEGEAGKIRFLRIESIVSFFTDRYFPGARVISRSVFRVLRDSDLDFEEKAEDSLLPIEKMVASALKKRPQGRFIRLEIEPTISVSLRDFVMRRLDIDESEVFVERDFMGIADLFQLIVKERPDLQFVPYEGRFPERVREHEGDCFAAIKAKDIVIHHPYESFDVVLQFLRQAADDPAVEVIKWTLYRTSKTDLRIVEALKDAARAKKTVMAFIEIKARFDEELNLRLAEEMQQAGVRVEYGFAELKTHAKLGLIARWEGGRLKSYCHIGTGNYHPLTAKIYTDVSFFTADDEICRDVARVFNCLYDKKIPSGLQLLSNSPHGIRAKVMQHIDEEIIHARAGRPAAIWMKMNALVDPGMIEKLYEASGAGVEIKLVVRGICCLAPGVPGQSERISVKSVIGRFLEHSRIFCFGNGEGLPSDKALVYISSADLMPRNLDRRVEIMTPIRNETAHEQILGQIMVAMLKDNQQSWKILPDGTSQRIAPAEGEEPFNAHDYFMRNPSLSGRGEALKKSAPPELHV